MQATRKWAILVAHHVIKCTPLAISKTFILASSNSLLFPLYLKCLTTVLRLLYSTFTASTHIVSERAIRFQQPSTECAKHLKSGVSSPYNSAATLAAFTLTPTPSPTLAIGSLSLILIWISVFVSKVCKSSPNLK